MQWCEIFVPGWPRPRQLMKPVFASNLHACILKLLCDVTFPVRIVSCTFAKWQLPTCLWASLTYKFASIFRKDCGWYAPQCKNDAKDTVASCASIFSAIYAIYRMDRNQSWYGKQADASAAAQVSIKKMMQDIKRKRRSIRIPWRTLCLLLERKGLQQAVPESM